MKNILLLLLMLRLFAACDSTQNTSETKQNPAAQQVKITNNSFNDYWYAGKAEINSYTLEQARYGEMRKGEAVLVFVTEDFSKKKQVKLDNASANKNDALPILKLNATRKFSTGLYPYSMMTSTFTPIDVATHPHTVKTTTSAQEWCGHTFEQLNLQSNSYEQTLHSYFESEGEQNQKITTALLEDELFNRIRIQGEDLPVGKMDIIPSGIFLRFKHLKTKAYPAMTSLEESQTDSSILDYTIQFPSLDRTLTVHFTKVFPHEIMAWEDTYKDGFGLGAKKLTTKAVRKKSMLLAYWNKNSNADSALREALDLD